MEQISSRMAKYAAETTVSSEASRAEIDRTLVRYGATGFMYGWQGERAVIGFELNGRAIRFVLKMPDPNDQAFTHTDVRRARRSADGQREAYEKAVRQKWRALALVIKAKLEAVESGIVEFDQEFMAHIVMPDGKTMTETMLPKMREALEGGTPPPMLPDYSH